ncbi:hypothetical protein SSABA_v1c06260 [Spiroplasma sabaudiense Ar-1343]|uniref:S1 motif domain-containing protein n=1 Tax=Spiroplasma sabaudiense Ar-1343 TaxID=1276257 RepID=W6AA19_9MOLU|nr:S1 RNA-binding domain-containing protein [Spiroplasma sabaudiense]AHI54028.1 hypothetical protein SSABA_v1c06260 [Spiroplasma sabaudiense Ar-1343]
MLNKGQIINAKVTSIVNYGVFSEVYTEDGELIAKGLIHISELSDFFVRDINSFFAIGDVIEVQVLEFDAPKKQVKLSYKALHPELLKGSENKIQETGDGFSRLEDSIDDSINNN